jgi:outer membrane protein assembly factor BamB
VNYAYAMDRCTRVLVAGLIVASMIGCTSPAKPKPVELPPATSLLSVQKVWSSNIGEVTFPLEVKAVASDVYIASGSGTVSKFDVQTGAIRWSVDLGTRIAAGVGTDGDKVAVVTASGELVTLVDGKKLWQQKLGAVALTPPLVAGGRVFVITPDRTLSALVRLVSACGSSSGAPIPLCWIVRVF